MSVLVRSIHGRGGRSALLTLAFLAACIPPEIVSFTATPATIAVGESTLLAWEARAGSCTALDGWSGAKPIQGSQSVSPTVTTTYTLRCDNAGTATSRSVVVTVTGSPRSGLWVTGYYAGYFWDWTGSDPDVAVDAVDMSTLTHLAFARYAPGGGTLGGTAGQLVEGAGTGHAYVEDPLIARAHANGAKALLVVGGAGEGAGFDVSTANASVRATFVERIIAKAVAKNYDGVDVDWEEHLDTAAQRSQVVALLTELRAAAGREERYQPPNQPFVLTWPAFWTNINYATVTPWHVQVASLVDQYNLMTYGMADTWPGWSSWHHSALFGAGPTYPTSVQASIAEYEAAGVPAAKLGIGIGLYGLYYTNGVTGPRQPIGASSWAQSGDWENNYVRLVEDGAFAQASGTVHWDDVAKQRYVSYAPAWMRWGNTPITYLSYEDADSIAAKGAWARTQGLGGAIVWTVNYGYLPAQGHNALMEAVRAGFLDAAAPAAAD
ncbi:MAG: glycoside hydrolase family 18 protein [bacterium]